MATQLFFEQRGTDGPILVFLHGVGASGRYWHAVADHLRTTRLRFYLIDLLGFGRSARPEVRYTPDDHLIALDSWRAALGLSDEPVVLVGHSVGAILSALWASRAPLVVGVILVGLPVYHDPVEARRRLAELTLLNRLTLGYSWLGQAACSVMCGTRPLWQLLAPLLAPQIPADVARDAVFHSWRSLSGTLEHCVFDLRSERLILPTKIPTILIHGIADRTAPIESVRDLVTRSTGVRLVEVSDGGHDLPLSHPRELAGEIGRFVESLRTAET